MDNCKGSIFAVLEPIEAFVPVGPTGFRTAQIEPSSIFAVLEPTGGAAPAGAVGVGRSTAPAGAVGVGRGTAPAGALGVGRGATPAGAVGVGRGAALVAAQVAGLCVQVAAGVHGRNGLAVRVDELGRPRLLARAGPTLGPEHSQRTHAQRALPTVTHPTDTRQRAHANGHTPAED